MFDKEDCRDDCKCDQRKENRCIDKIVITVLVILFVFVIGIIIGATTGIFDLLGVAAFIVIAVALGVLIIIRAIILSICDNKKRC